MRILIERATLILAARWIIGSLLAYATVRNFKFSEGFFALVTIAAIIRSSLSDTCVRSITRAFGTILGAILTYLMLVASQGNLVFIISGSVAISFLAGYIMLQNASLSYLGIMVGITMVNVLALSTMGDTDFVATVDRVAYVFLGIGCMLVVDLCFSAWTRQALFSKVMARDLWITCTQLIKQDQKKHLLSALQLAIAIVITLLPWLIYQYHGGFWAAVSCFFIIEESLSGTKLKSEKRFYAHVAAAVMGGFIVLLSAYFFDARIILWLLSLFIISVFMIMKKQSESMGNTMGIALTIMVMGGGDDNVIYRFIYTLFGIIVGLIVCKIFSKRWAYVELAHV